MVSSDVLKEYEKFFRIKQGDSTIDVPKSHLSDAYQETLRGKIKPTEIIETDTFIPQPLPVQPMITPEQPQLQPSVQAPMQQPMQPPMETVRKEVILPEGGQHPFSQERQALGQIGQLEGMKAAETAKIYNQAQDELMRGEAQRQLKFNQYQEAVNTQVQEYQRTVNDLATAKVDPDRFWSSKSMPQKASAFIGIMLSGIGSGMQGSRNSALDVIDKAMQADIDAQKIDIDKKGKLVNLQGNLLSIMRTKYNDEMTAEAATRSTMLEKLKLQLQGTAALYDNPLIQERANIAIAQLDQKKMAYDQEVASRIQSNAIRAMEVNDRRALEHAKFGLEREKFEHEKTKEAGGPKLNEEQKKAAGFAVRLEQSMKDFGELQSKGYNRADVSSGVGSKFPNIVRSEAAVRQDQAERNFVNAVLRRESGAAITPSEFENAELQYFPRVGDSKGVLQQKERNRKAILGSFKASAGKKAFEEAESGYKSELENQTRYINGKEYKKVRGGWESAD